jgi:hypothetical protein
VTAVLTLLGKLRSFSLRKVYESQELANVKQKRT